MAFEQTEFEVVFTCPRHPYNKRKVLLKRGEQIQLTCSLCQKMAIIQVAGAGLMPKPAFGRRIR